MLIEEDPSKVSHTQICVNTREFARVRESSDKVPGKYAKVLGQIRTRRSERRPPDCELARFLRLDCGWRDRVELVISRRKGALFLDSTHGHDAGWLCFASACFGLSRRSSFLQEGKSPPSLRVRHLRGLSSLTYEELSRAGRG